MGEISEKNFCARPKTKFLIWAYCTFEGAFGSLGD